MISVESELARRLVPDGLWATVEPLLPPFAPRRQGGGSAPVDERAVFTAVVYVLTDGCAWRGLPPSFGVSPATAHRRFTTWTEAGVWRRLHRAAADGSAAATAAEPTAGSGPAGGCELDWVAAIAAAATARGRRATT